MSNVVEQLTPNPVSHEHGENGCCPDPRAWELEMMHQVWAAGLHDAANCFHEALKAKWELESQKQVKPKTNGDKIRAMADEELLSVAVEYICGMVLDAEMCGAYNGGKVCRECCLAWLRSPVEGSHE